MSFKAMRPPADAEMDWTDSLSNKYLPAAGAVIGGIAGGYFSGGNPAGVMAGSSIGAGAGQMVGGLISNKPESAQSMANGYNTAQHGAANYPWAKDLGTPQVGAAQPPAAAAAKPDDEKIQSFYAKRTIPSL